MLFHVVVLSWCFICLIVGSDGKKVGGHVATPHPAKKAVKTPGNKPNQQSPQSGGPHSCKTCNRYFFLWFYNEIRMQNDMTVFFFVCRTFGSDKALESHSKAKHAGK